MKPVEGGAAILLGTGAVTDGTAGRGRWRLLGRRSAGPRAWGVLPALGLERAVDLGPPCPSALTLISKGTADTHKPWEAPTSLFNDTAEHTANGEHRCSCCEDLQRPSPVEGQRLRGAMAGCVQAEGGWPGLTEAPSPCLCDPGQTTMSLSCNRGKSGTTVPA